MKQEMPKIYEDLKTKIEEAKKASEGSGKSNISVADEIKKFKELLDLGIINQAEFDEKKKQLLGL